MFNAQLPPPRCLVNEALSCNGCQKKNRSTESNQSSMMKITNVIPMKTRLRNTICNVGEIVEEETKRGKNARKNTESLGFRMFMRKPL